MTPDRHTRRSFLQGRAAADALAGIGDRTTIVDAAAESVAEPASPSPQPSRYEWPESLLVSIRRRAMACEWEVQLAAGREDDSMEHVFTALDLVEKLEDQLTVYRTESEVQAINRLAAARPVRVEPRLFGLFQLARRLYDETDGALDITSGPLSDTWGFSRRRGRIPDPVEIAAALLRVGMSDVVLDPASQTIAFQRPDITVNFNSIGKGYALDRMAELLDLAAVGNYLLHGGRSSVLARGDHPGEPAGSGWSIGLRHPLRTAERLAEFRLRDQALSTSGSGTQFFRRRGRTYGHILNPRTGRPVEGIFSATVIAPTAAEADALSTAFYVMGPEKTADYCATRPELAAVIVCPTNRQGDVRLFAFGLDSTSWTQLAER